MARHGGEDRIGFKSLLDQFGYSCREELQQFDFIQDQLPELQHFIATKITNEAETCRKILTMGFQLDSSKLREILDTKDATMLALYRGFSRFMLEDLATNAYTRHLSKSQLRKTSSKIAFEMIQVIPFLSFKIIYTLLTLITCSETRLTQIWYK